MSALTVKTTNNKTFSTCSPLPGSTLGSTDNSFTDLLKAIAPTGRALNTGVKSKVEERPATLTTSSNDGEANAGVATTYNAAGTSGIETAAGEATRKRTVVMDTFYKECCADYYKKLRLIFADTLLKLEDKEDVTIGDLKHIGNIKDVTRWKNDITLQYTQLANVGDDEKVACQKLLRKWHLPLDKTNGYLMHELKRMILQIDCAVKDIGYWEDKYHHFFSTNPLVLALRATNDTFVTQYGIPSTRYFMLTTFLKNRKAQRKIKQLQVQTGK
jgi:hypothetical protein